MEGRERIPRRRSLKTAKLIIARQQSVINCKVHNLTEGGACLVMGSPLWAPETFDLVVPVDNVRRSCRVLWRLSDKIGVEFVKQKAG
jgi:hypothetical protein